MFEFSAQECNYICSPGISGVTVGSGGFLNPDFPDYLLVVSVKYFLSPIREDAHKKC